MKPTDEQQPIIDDNGSCVVIAAPGSGKTFTMCQKIKRIVDGLPPHRGVVAISFTNKSSKELRERCERLGISRGSNFFGTIDSFCISEIVKPFFRHMFGISDVDVRVVTLQNSKLNEEHKSSIGQRILGGVLDKAWVEYFGDVFKKGEIVLESVPKVALWLIQNNSVLQKYLKARYEYIFIDEYQDSSADQHHIFLEFHSLGIKSVAVGDINQSIYGFRGTSPDYILSLTKRDDFRKYIITHNKRCHPSISSYAAKVLNPKFQVLRHEELMVFTKSLQGREEAIGQWIDKTIEIAMERLGVVKKSEVAILCRSNKTVERIKSSIKKHKVHTFCDTPLSASQEPWAIFFTHCLSGLLSKETGIIENLESYLNSDQSRVSIGKSIKQLIKLKARIIEKNVSPEEIVRGILAAANTILPDYRDEESIKILEEICISPELLHLFVPPADDSIQLMTIHKAKGLEFDIVYHLDLAQWILPSWEALKGDKFELAQDICLHYVAITRAKKACILCLSSHRVNWENQVKEAVVSDFVNRSDLVQYRRRIGSF